MMMEEIQLSSLSFVPSSLFNAHQDLKRFWRARDTEGRRGKEENCRFRRSKRSGIELKWKLPVIQFGDGCSFSFQVSPKLEVVSRKQIYLRNRLNLLGMNLMEKYAYIAHCRPL